MLRQGPKESERRMRAGRGRVCDERGEKVRTCISSHWPPPPPSWTKSEPPADPSHSAREHDAGTIIQPSEAIDCAAQRREEETLLNQSWLQAHPRLVGSATASEGLCVSACVVFLYMNT